MLSVRHNLARIGVLEAAAAVAAIPCSSSGRLAPQLAAQFSTAEKQSVEDVDTLVAEPRTEFGRRGAAKLRKAGRTPGVLFSFPDDEEKFVSFDAKTIEQQLSRLGRTGWACNVFNVRLQGPDGEQETIPALGRQVHITADTDVIENVTLIHCPPERMVRVDIPVKVFGEESCPGLKAGGRINWIKRTVPCLAPGNRIPSHFEIDVSQMKVKQRVLMSDLPLPEGVILKEQGNVVPLLKIVR